MARVVILSSSPTENSKTEALLEIIARRLRQYGHRTEMLKLRRLPAAPLLAADVSDPLIAAARATVESADAVVVGSPVYKASYSGLLKVFIDLLPMDVLHGVPALPVLTGGSPAHVLALDFGLKPLLATLGASSIARGRFVLSKHILTTTEASSATLDEASERDLVDAIDHFESELRAKDRACAHARTELTETELTGAEAAATAPPAAPLTAEPIPTTERRAS